MGKNNVNPNHYKIAGRDRQGEDILQERHKERFALNQARERFEQRQPLPFASAPAAQDETSEGGDTATEETSGAEPVPERRAAKPAKQTARKTAPGRQAKKKATGKGRQTATADGRSAGARGTKAARTGPKKAGTSRAKQAAPSSKKKASRAGAGRATGGAKKGPSRSARR